MRAVESPPERASGRPAQAGRGIVGTQALRLAVRIGTTVALARMVAPADYGVFGMAALLHGLVYMMQDLGLSMLTLRTAQLGDSERNTLFWLNAATGLAIALLVTGTAPLVGSFFGDGRLVAIVPVLASTFLLHGLHTQLRAQLAREQRFAEVNRVEIASFVLSSAAAVIVAALGGGYWALATLPVTAEALLLAGIWRAQRWRPARPALDVAGVAARLRSALPLSSTDVLRYAQRNIDALFVGRWFGADALGYYGRGGQLVALPLQYIVDPLGPWAVTTLSRPETPPEGKRLFWRGLLNGLAHLAFPLAVMCWCFPSEILHVAFGFRWTPGADMLRNLAPALVAHPVLACATWLLIAAARPRRLVLWSIANAALVSLACVAFGRQGPEALALAASAAFLGAAAGAVLACHGLASIADFAGALFRPLALALVAAVAAGALVAASSAIHPLERLGLGGAAVAACWLGGAAVSGVRRELGGHFLRRPR